MTEFETIKMRYIQRVTGDACGPHNSRFLYYRNIHTSWHIRIFVNNHWIYNGEEISEKKEYVLSPNPTFNYNLPNSLDAYMGCPIPGPTLQTFHWDIYDAKIEKQD